MKKIRKIQIGLGLVVSLVAVALVLVALHPVFAPAFPGGKKKRAAKGAALNLSGTVKKTMDSGGYTYVLLKNDAGEIWVAVPKVALKVGQQVTFAPGMVMKNFKSETLKRTFPEVVFSSGLANGAGGSSAAMAGGGCPGQVSGGRKEGKTTGVMPGMGAMGGMAAMGSSGRVVTPPLDLKLDKAAGDNGYTVAELYAKGKELDEQKVRVHAKVVKVSRAIMGKNWIHLQDGTGAPDNGTHDLVATSQQDPKVGEIVTVEGTLRADKDFGAGYRYEVILEEATFKED